MDYDQEMSVIVQFCYPRVALGMRVADGANVANNHPDSDKGLQTPFSQSKINSNFGAVFISSPPVSP